MSRVNYVVVFSSPNYRELIYSSLNKHGMIFTEPVKEDEKYLLEYVRKSTVEISNNDAFIIDLSVLKDTDEQIIEAIEAIRFLDDKVRIIILEGTRNGSESLLRHCFLNGIYNLISLGDYINTKEKLEKCLLDGMSYKDALIFKDSEAKRSKTPTEIPIVGFQNKTIAFLGTQERIGTTHCVITTAFTLRKCGYLVAVIDCTGSQDYLELMKSYEQHLNDEECFSIDEVDFYIKPISDNSIGKQSNSYNFIIYDFGAYILDAEKALYTAADERILVTGSKPWELPRLANMLQTSFVSTLELKYLFNLTNPALETDLKKIMRAAGIEKNVFFMEYIQDFFSVSDVVKEMLQVVPQKTKKGWFRKR